MPDDSAARPPGPLGSGSGVAAAAVPDARALSRPESLEGPASWRAASVTLAILSVSYGAPLLVVVGLATMQADLGTDRSVLALAGALVWIGTGLGGVVMGRVAERIGMRATTCFGAVMMAAGLALSATGKIWALYVGHGVLMGLLGNGAIYPPLVTYVSRWFDRRRGTAIALISSGQYIAGVVWPWLFERAIARFGWRAAMLGFAVVVLGAILPLAVLFLHPPPEPAGAAAAQAGTGRATRQAAARVLGLRPGLAQALLCLAGFCCCVPMSIPSAHLVAYCGDLGIGAARGAAMLSVLLGCAFASRQLWGLFADRYGGLRTVITGSALQALAIFAFLLTQNEAGLFAVSAAFGFGFAGIIPGYVLAVRDLFPAVEAAWRVPLVLFTSMGGMAFGSWFAGALYDHYGYYAPAFGAGVLFNLANLSVVGFLVVRQGGRTDGRGTRWRRSRRDSRPFCAPGGIPCPVVQPEQPTEGRRMADAGNGAPRRAAAGFAAGAVSVLVFHQGAWAVLHALGMMPAPFPTAPVPPFGVPRIYDLCFWGGLYGAVFGLFFPMLPARGIWFQGVLLGLIAELGSLYLVPAIKGLPLAFGGAERAIVISTLINATWGLGVGLFIPLVAPRGRLGRLRSA